MLNGWTLSGIIPRTDAWREWERHVVADDQADPKELYEDIVEAHGSSEGSHATFKRGVVTTSMKTEIRISSSVSGVLTADGTA